MLEINEGILIILRINKYAFIHDNRKFAKRVFYRSIHDGRKFPQIAFYLLIDRVLVKLKMSIYLQFSRVRLDIYSFNKYGQSVIISDIIVLMVCYIR